MANILKLIFRNNTCSSLLKLTPVTHNLENQVRCLYSKVTLGLETYVQQRERTQNQLANISDKFKSKMIEYTSSETSKMIFTEDLKNMVHLAKEEDVDLVINMMVRFNEQNKEMRFGNFIFGPVVLRMFHFLNKPTEALECFNNPKLEGFFDQLISYQILLDLLYENQRYQDVLNTFEKVISRQLEGTKYPKNVVVLAFAACYKLNTQESLKYALKLWSDLRDVGHLPMRRAVTYCAALALKQGQPEACLEIVSSTKNQNYTTIRNLKVNAFAKIGRVEEIIPLLKSILNQETPMKHTFNKDVIEIVDAAVEKLGSTEIQHEYKKIKEYFTENEHISDMTLDEQLCKEIVPPPFMGMGNQRQPRRQFPQSRYQRNDRTVRFQRPGLQEMQ